MDGPLNRITKMRDLCPFTFLTFALTASLWKVPSNLSLHLREGRTETRWRLSWLQRLQPRGLTSKLSLQWRKSELEIQYKVLTFRYCLCPNCPETRLLLCISASCQHPNNNILLTLTKIKLCVQTLKWSLNEYLFHWIIIEVIIS